MIYEKNISPNKQNAEAGINTNRIANNILEMLGR